MINGLIVEEHKAKVLRKFCRKILQQKSVANHRRRAGRLGPTTDRYVSLWTFTRVVPATETRADWGSG